MLQIGALSISSRASLLAIIGLSFMCFGCREYSYYGYKPVELAVLGGELVIEVEGSYENYEEEGKKLARWSNPYYLRFRYSVDRDHPLEKVQVRDLVLIGDNGATITLTGSYEGATVIDHSVSYDKNSRIKECSLSVGDLKKHVLEHQSYTLKATFVVYENEETVRKENISVPLESHYRKEKRSDWFDTQMGV